MRNYHSFLRGCLAGAKVVSFIVTLIGSFVVGILLSVLMAAIVKHSELSHNLVLEQGLVVLFVYVP